MFENVILQPAVSALVSDIAAERLPPSMLFSGPPYSGKLTAALELARVISCETGRGEWMCSCASCMRHKELGSSDTLIMGARDCVLEIKAAAASFLSCETPPPASRYLFIRSVRKLTLRFHPVFTDGDEGRFAKASPSLSALNDALEELSPAYPLPERAALEKLVASVVETAAKLDDAFLYSSIPVNYVRSVSSWLRIKPAGKVKVLIVENVETMQDSARNAFLKILEEPPENVVFVLTAVKKNAVMPTILSRVRNYSFIQRDAAAEEEILRRVFKVSPSEGETVRAFMNRFLPVHPDVVKECASRFLFSVLSGGPFCERRRARFESLREILFTGAKPPRVVSLQELSVLLNKFKPDAVWRLFLLCILDVVRRTLHSSSLAPRETEICRRWIGAVKKAHDGTSVLNVSPSAAISRLEYEMRSCV